ncbi:MAG: phosphatidate cytidylyltransferase [Cyanobium sp.]
MSQLLAVVLPGVLAAVLVGGLGMALASRGLAGEQLRARWLKFGVYLLVIASELLLAAAGALLWLALPVLLIAALECRRVLTRAGQERISPGERRGWWLAAVVLAAGLVGFCLLLPAAVQLLVVLEVLGFDGFSQVSGQLFGRHALVPRLSPAKTWEGLIGGTAACLLLAGLLRPLLGVPTGSALLLGAMTAALALAGDLGASALKRRCGVKDFSRLIPGHGGVLDRFDSLLAVGTGWCLLTLITGG